MKQKNVLQIFQEIVWLCRSVKNGGPSRSLNVTVHKNNIFLLSYLFMVNAFNWKK